VKKIVIYKKQFKESDMGNKKNIIINPKYFIKELLYELKKNQVDVSFKTKKILGSKDNSKSFYKTVIENENFNLEILHFLNGIAFISLVKYNMFAKSSFSFDDDYAETLEKYSNSKDVLDNIIFDITKE